MELCYAFDLIADLWIFIYIIIECDCHLKIAGCDILSNNELIVFYIY